MKNSRLLELHEEFVKDLSHEKVNALSVLLSSYRASLLSTFEKEIEGKKTKNYNQTKKNNCESCGVAEGSLCHDGCLAMDERYKNQALNDCLEIVRKVLS